MALADVHHLLGLARYSLLDPDGARTGAEIARGNSCPDASGARPRSGRRGDLALADQRRERGE